MSKVYLAGPIAGLSYEQVTGWRDYATEKLLRLGITAISPMRNKGFLKDRKRMPSAEVMDDKYGLTKPHSYVTRDRLDVFRCDALLVNLLDTDRVSIGTMCELGWADILRKPVVLVMRKGSVHDHGFVRELSHFHCTDLDTAIDIIAAIL